MEVSCSTFGVSDDKWNFAAKATVVTMNCSFGGGSAALAICYIIYRAVKSYCFNLKKRLFVP